MKVTYSEAVAAGYTHAYLMSYGCGMWDVLVKADADLDEEVTVYVVELGAYSTHGGWLWDWEFDGVVVVTDTI